MRIRRRLKRAVVLLSGGLDSAVALYEAKAKGYECFCLLFDYGQRHLRELASAKSLAKRAGCDFTVVKIALPKKGTSLIDKTLGLPQKINRSKIPSTYVPARNIVFLSFALSYAEGIAAEAIFLGIHAQDYSGYPDCRPDFVRAFQKVISCGTKAGVEGRAIKIEAPLLRKKKSQIVRSGIKLGVPFELTRSCYRGGKKPCGLCDSCRYRAMGFKEAGQKDPALS